MIELSTEANVVMSTILPAGGEITSPLSPDPSGPLGRGVIDPAPPPAPLLPRAKPPELAPARFAPGARRSKYLEPLDGRQVGDRYIQRFATGKRGIGPGCARRRSWRRCRERPDAAGLTVPEFGSLGHHQAEIVAGQIDLSDTR